MTNAVEQEGEKKGISKKTSEWQRMGSAIAEWENIGEDKNWHQYTTNTGGTDTLLSLRQPQNNQLLNKFDSTVRLKISIEDTKSSVQ